jgi:glycerol uptake facilitator-like aquaporin
MVAAWIGAAYWFTASTSFANPAAAVGRMFSDSFAGVAPASVPGFVIAELIGAALGLGLSAAWPAAGRADRADHRPSG